MENESQITQETPETTDGFLDGWGEQDSESTADTQSETTPAQEQVQTDSGSQQETPAEGQGEAGSQTQPETTGGDAGGENAQQQAEAQPKADAPKMWTLRHMDEVRQVGEADMVVLAQKGLDYDRIRGKYDESKPVMELFGSFAKQAGMSIPDYVSFIRTQAKQASGMSEAEARRTVELEDREAAVSAKEAEETQRQQAANQAQQARNDADARRRADIAEFQKTFPDAAKDPKSIPAEVWADVRNGRTLVAAYAKYAVAQANAKANAAEQRAETTSQNQKNAGRSTGSMRSAGDSVASKDPFLEGWDS